MIAEASYLNDLSSAKTNFWVLLNMLVLNMFAFSSPTPGSRQASPTEAVERMATSQSGMEMMAQHHPHVLQQHNPTQNKPLAEDFQNQEAQNIGGLEQQAGVESLQFDYAGNQIQVDSSGAAVGLFDYNSQQQVCLKSEHAYPDIYSHFVCVTFWCVTLSSCSRGLIHWLFNSSLQLSNNSMPWLQPNSSILVGFQTLLCYVMF